MSYCSLSEAYGDDFVKQVNTNFHMGAPAYPVKQMNPTRNNNAYGNLDRSNVVTNTQNGAMEQSNRDVDIHRQSFMDVSPPSMYNTNQTAPRAWSGEIDELSPKEFLKKSLLRDRKIQSPHQNVERYDEYEPRGYSESIIRYSSLNKSPCQDYFYHLDTCRRCQHKLKKRVIRYFKALQRNNKNPLLPGTTGLNSNYLIDKELFMDNDDEEPEQKQEQKQQVVKESKVTENFSNQEQDLSPAIFLMLFGLFIIYTLDSSKRMLSK